MGTPEPGAPLSPPYDTTLRYFGPYWSVDPVFGVLHIPDPPAGTTCGYCVETIKPGRRGVRLPSLNLFGDAGFAYYHVMCFLVSICGEDVARQAANDNPQLAEEPFPG